MRGRVIIYLRSSTDRQDSGLEAQERAIESYCKRNGIEDYEVFQDRGVSGKKASRPKLDEMMALVLEKKVKAVIVYSFSRFARSTKHLLEALEIFKETDTDFISICEQIETNSPVGKLFFTLIAALSQFEAELVSERVRNGLKNAAAKGRYPGRPKTKHEKSIVSLRQKGMSYRQISEILGVGHSTIYRVLNSVPNDDD